MIEICQVDVGQQKLWAKRFSRSSSSIARERCWTLCSWWPILSVRNIWFYHTVLVIIPPTRVLPIRGWGPRVQRSLSADKSLRVQHLQVLWQLQCNLQVLLCHLWPWHRPRRATSGPRDRGVLVRKNYLQFVLSILHPGQRRQWLRTGFPWKMRVSVKSRRRRTAMTEREEITSVKFMNCSNFQRLYPATSLPSPHLPMRKMSK